MRIYPTMSAFLNEDERRLRSGEADYGRHWRLAGWPHTWRASYVHLTGEIYVIYEAVAGPVFVLGTVPPDHYDESPGRRDLYYATLDRILEGWPERCGEFDGMYWLRDRIIAAMEVG